MSCRLGYVKLVKFLFQVLSSVMSSFCQVCVKFLSSVMCSFVKFVIGFVKCHVIFCQALCQVFVKCYVLSPIKCYVKCCCTLLPYCLGLQYCVLQVLRGNTYF